MEIEEKDLNVLVSHFMDDLIRNFGPNRLLDIYVSLKKQLNDLEDTWFSQKAMSKIINQGEIPFECEEVKTDGAFWKINFAKSIKDDLTELDDQKRTKIIELLKRASLSVNPKIEGYRLPGNFWCYQIDNGKFDICRIACKFDSANSIILVLKISPPYENIVPGE